MSGTAFDLTALVNTGQATNQVLTAMIRAINGIPSIAIVPPTAGLLGGNAGTFVPLGVGGFLEINGGTLVSGKQITVAATVAGTYTIVPTEATTNVMVHGPAAGGAVTLDIAASLALGQAIVMNVSQGATAATWTFNTGFNFGTTVPAPTITAVAGKRDVIGLINNVGTVFDMTWISQGFTP